ncbi:rod shape-determining protein MreC [Clostridium sp. DL1XJH146]
MRRKKTINKLTVTILVLSVAFLGIIGYSNNSTNKNFLESFLGTIINPIQSGLYKINDNIIGNISIITNLNEVKEENKNLKEENIELQNKIANYDSLQAENDRLTGLLNIKDTMSEYDYVGCEIVGKTGQNIYDGFVINRGSEDDLYAGMVVINSSGLVGRIISVGKNWSIVQTVLNENIAIAALIEDTRESDCIVRGYTDFDDEKYLKLSYLSIENEIKEGDTISTSGIGEIYPKGIKIGTVLEIEEDKGKLSKSAIIDPIVDFNTIEELLVVIPKETREVTY